MHLGLTLNRPQSLIMHQLATGRFGHPFEGWRASTPRPQFPILRGCIAAAPTPSPAWQGGRKGSRKKLASVHLELARCVWDVDRCCLDRLIRWVAGRGDRGCTVYRRLPA